MATVTLANSRASTSNVATYVGNGFAPAVGDVLVHFVAKTGSTNNGTVTDTGSNPWTQLTAAACFIGGGAAADRVEVFATTQQLTSASTITVTYDCTGDNATGANVATFRVAGCDGAYLRQWKANTGGSSTTPTCSMDLAINTNNAVVAMAANGANPAALTPPSSWTEGADIGFATPASGAEFAYRSPGETNSVVSWGGTSGTSWGAIVVELYTSGQGVTLDDSRMGFFGVLQAR